MRQLNAIVMTIATFGSVTFADTAHWPQFRGAQSDGLAEGERLPDRWSTTENVVWKTDIPGRGWSSPVIWGDKIFVTSAVGETELPKPVIGPSAEGGVKPGDVQRWMVYCLDWTTGKIVWEREAHKGVPPRERHLKNSYATETPSTDGARIYAYFGNLGLFAYDMNGNKIWEQKWGSFRMLGGWGTGASPVLHKDRLYLVNDNEDKSFMVALDKLTGKQIWRVERQEKSNWATPYIWENENRTELVTPGTGKMRSYDLDGKLLWELAGMTSRLMPVAKQGLLYVGAGSPGPLYAIRPGASGDISLKPEETKNDWIVWSQPKGGPLHPSLLISGERLYSLLDAGFLSCYDAKTGKVVYDRQRLHAGGGQFYASPWAYHGKVFLLNEDGTTLVIQDGPEFKQLGSFSLEDHCWATPAIARGSLFIRTNSKLYRLQEIKGRK